MARKKGGKSKGYVSNGERPNVNKKTMNGVNAERPFDVDAHMRSQNVKRDIIYRPHGAKEAELKKRYQAEQEVEVETARLLNRYGVAGMTKAEAVMAVKTNFVENLHKKWGPRLRNYLREQEKKKGVFANLAYI